MTITDIREQVAILAALYVVSNELRKSPDPKDKAHVALLDQIGRRFALPIMKAAAAAGVTYGA